MNDFTKNAVRIIGSIPAGRVMTYGQIAASAGNRRGARQVVRVLHSMSQVHDLPWHRVINAQGRISAPAQDEEKGFIQRTRLESEGIQFTADGTIDLDIYRWHPQDIMENE